MNNRKIFPVLTIILLLISAVTSFLYLNEVNKNKTQNADISKNENQLTLPPQTNPQVTLKIIQDHGIKTYSNNENGLSFEYPEKLSIEQIDQNTIGINHSVPHTYYDPCNFKEGLEITEFVDFKVKMELLDEDLETAIINSGYDFVVGNHLKDGELITEGFIKRVNFNNYEGYTFSIGAEGCGMNEYFMIIDENKTLYITQKYITELMPGILAPEFTAEMENLPGVILPEQKEKYFNEIMNSLNMLGDIKKTCFGKYFDKYSGISFEYNECKFGQTEVREENCSQDPEFKSIFINFTKDDTKIMINNICGIWYEYNAIPIDTFFLNTQNNIPVEIQKSKSIDGEKFSFTTKSTNGLNIKVDTLLGDESEQLEKLKEIVESIEIEDSLP